jgi:class 3 adenylate cyclase
LLFDQSHFVAQWHYQLPPEEFKTDPANGRVSIKGMAFIPHPERYQEVPQTEPSLLFDRMTGKTLTRDQFNECLLKQFKANIPIRGFLRPLDEANDYFFHRVMTGLRILQGSIQYEQNQLGGYRDNYVKSKDIGSHFMAVLAIDIVRSTQLAITVGNDTFSRIARVVELEAANWTAKFAGAHLKYIGDGALLGFYNPQNEIWMPDQFNIGPNPIIRALFVAALVRSSLEEYISPLMVTMGLPALQVRFGIDYGEVEVQRVDDGETTGSFEFHGATVNIASKLQSLGRPWDVILGEDAYFNLASGVFHCFFGAVSPEFQAIHRKSGELYRAFILDGPIELIDHDYVATQFEKLLNRPLPRR